MRYVTNAYTFLLMVTLSVGHAIMAQEVIRDQPSSSEGVGKAAVASKAVVHVRTIRLLVHADLGRSEAKAIADRLEMRIRRLEKYWAMPLRGRIECYLVSDISAWQAADFPDAIAHAALTRVGGLTTITNDSGTPIARLYAMHRPGIAEHEIVHAYCGLVFSHEPPDWYREGIAEYFANVAGGEHGVRISDAAIESLRASPMRSVQAIMDARPFTNRISNSMVRISNEGSSDSWSENDERDVARAKASYYWSWALCHFLATHGQYRDEFRKFGQRHLSSGSPVGDPLSNHLSRDQHWRRLNAEFQFFVRQIENGYELCASEWQWPEQILADDWESFECEVFSRCGFQSAARVHENTRYAYQADGNWSVDADGPQATADGREDGRGRLEAVIVRGDGSLSETLELGTRGIVTAPCDGLLMLHCRCHCGRMKGHRGSLRFRLQRVESNDVRPK